MCGIVAVYSRDRGSVDPAVARRMRDGILHRGPDDSGLFYDDYVALAHRRLSIIDLKTGQQPMSDASGTVWITYNGEIYNFRELRSQLVAQGYPFKTQSDTEVILALYNRDGESFVSRLNGIFSMALWDSRDKRMLLIRDRVGVKPLYIWSGNGIVAAASEIKALLHHPAIAAEVNRDVVAEYLAFRQVAGRATLFRGIETVAPGGIVEVRDGAVSSRTYWELPHSGAPANGDVDASVDKLDELLRDASQMQLISDVPVGTYSSGGIDSSLVTSYVAEVAGADLNTFCIGLEDPRLDERPYSQLVADRFRTNHRNLLVTEEALAESLPAVIWHHDEPLTHPNTLPIYLLSQLAKQHATVVLTGEGADEFFGGYPRYRICVLLEGLGALRPLAAAVARLIPTASLNSRWHRLLNCLQGGPDASIVELSRYVADMDLRPTLARTLDVANGNRQPAPTEQSLLTRILEYDQRNYLQPILNRLDKATMAFGVEARVPFLDHRLLEFSATLSRQQKVTLRDNKVLVKELARRRLPRPVVTRRKSGLSLPLAAWFRNPKGMGRFVDMLLEPCSLQREYLDGCQVRLLARQHRSGSRDHSELLWGLVNLELWHREFIDSPTCSPV